MTIAELIEELKKHPSESKVFTVDHYYGYVHKVTGFDKAENIISDARNEGISGSILMITEEYDPDDELKKQKL